MYKKNEGTQIQNWVNLQAIFKRHQQKVKLFYRRNTSKRSYLKDSLGVKQTN